MVVKISGSKILDNQLRLPSSSSAAPVIYTSWKLRTVLYIVSLPRLASKVLDAKTYAKIPDDTPVLYLNRIGSEHA